MADSLLGGACTWLVVFNISVGSWRFYFFLIDYDKRKSRVMGIASLTATEVFILQ